MQQKLDRLFLECKNELNSLGIDIDNEKKYGKIEISISKRNNKRYGCCKQEKPDKRYKTIIKRKRRKIIRYERFEEHSIEISPWVMELEEKIIKNTIMHELIHCMPYCNNHGLEFKRYAYLINKRFGYDISRVGDKKSDLKESNITPVEEKYKYKIVCKGCNQEFYRKRLLKYFSRKYRCGKCGGKFEVIQMDI